MAITNYAQSWKDVYDQYKSVVNFVAGDFDSLKDVIRKYIILQNPENYNDWAESSEVGMFANGLAYLGESIHYRVDLNAHDIFPSTTERRQSLLNFVKMLSYSPKRNICANGIAKLNSISTTQSVYDTSGNLLKDTVITWNDSSNPDWLEQFLTVMNSGMVSNNPFGKPLKKEYVDGVTTQLYELNNTVNNNAVYSFTASVNANTQQFEVVNADIDTTLGVIYERTPMPEQAFHILYRNDGTGNSSKNTGFFVYWKQGSLQSEYNNFTQKIENNYYAITTNNINEYDVWVQEVDGSTGLVKENWTKIANNEYLVYNNTDSTIRNVYKVETRENDNVIVRFSDGKFGNIPVGVFRFWYRVSQGNSNLYIKPSDIKNVSIRIPYKSNNTTDDNIYYLTLTFSVEDISHIKQSVPQESMEYIRERSPQVYSTQNRMVTGQDYNYFPKSFGQQLRVVNAINRTYAGNSRYIKFNDPTGVYQDLSILAEDGYLYKQNVIYTNEIADDDNVSSREVIIRDILPLLNSTNLNNFFYDNYPSISINYQSAGGGEPQKMRWKELYSEGTNTSYGVLVDEDGVTIPYKNIVNQIFKGSLLKFTSPEYDGDIWVNVLDVIVNNNDESYTVVINEVLGDSYNWSVVEYKWSLEEGYQPFITSFPASLYTEMELLLDDKISFGLTYDYSLRTWRVINGEELADDSIDFNYSSPYTDDGKYRNWIMKVNYSSPKSWIFKVRYLDYIFGSENKVSFFFNTDEKINGNSFYTRDYIKILQLNSKSSGDLFKEDYYWKPSETIRYSDGYTDTRQVKVYGYDSDKDGLKDNPVQFQEITSSNLKNLYFMVSDDELDYFNSSVIEIPTLWEHTTTSAIYFCELSGTIYPKGTKIPQDVTITKTVKLSNGRTIVASTSNPHTFEKGEIFDYDVVDEGKVVTWKWASDLDPTISSVEDELIEFDSQPVASELVKWNTTEETLTRYTKDEWYTRKGIDKLKFIWQHYASSSYIIDPCPTNIIDIFALTNTYYNNIQNWLLNGKKGTFPKLPSSYELKSIFAELENYNMVSDTIVWHPVKYKLLFGNEADNEYKANFRVIKNENSVMSDNEIKQQIIEAIDSYFSSMKAGEKFFFTQLSTYIHERLGTNIGTVLIVPSFAEDKFGNLFEINCEEDEILLSSATIDNVQIISRITDNNIRIGE